jgi:hypothetical protein
MTETMSRRLSGRRKYELRDERRVIHIYSEGTVTEPQYFHSIKRELRLSQVDIKPHGTSRSTLSLVEYVLAERGSNSQDEFWVVFDRDEHADFNKAVQLGETNGLNIAYSNECFELWFILHFNYLESALGRGAFPDMLTKLLGTKYLKNLDIYPLLREREKVAIRNAKRLDLMHDRASTTSHQQRTPSTTVYKLIERLRSLV